MKVTNILLNFSVDEDSQVSVEKCPLSLYQYLDYILLDLNLVKEDEIRVEKSTVLEKLKAFVEEKKKEWDDEEYLLTLDKCFEQFENDLNELLPEDEDSGIIMLAREWAVEVDSNYVVVIKLYEDVDFVVEAE